MKSKNSALAYARGSRQTKRPNISDYTKEIVKTQHQNSVSETKERANNHPREEKKGIDVEPDDDSFVSNNGNN